jgi:hypothetical protein
MMAAADKPASAAAHRRKRFGWLRVRMVGMVFIAEVLDR